MSGKDFLGGVVIGALLGAAAGLLLAPQAGEETRNAIGEHAKEVGGKMRESSRQLVESGRELLEQSKTQMSSAMQTAREKAEALMPSAEKKA